MLQWDPQRAQWNIMFQKLQEFAKDNKHCKVPKGYLKDPELANWVRNQRLEYANLQRNKKTRMTADRVERLDEMGFKWSTATPVRRKWPTDTIVKDAAVMAKTQRAPTESKKKASVSLPPLVVAAGLPMGDIDEKTLLALADSGGVVPPCASNEVGGEESLVMSV
jgi:hypothetical protein